MPYFKIEISKTRQSATTIGCKTKTVSVEADGFLEACEIVEENEPGYTIDSIEIVHRGIILPKQGSKP